MKWVLIILQIALCACKEGLLVIPGLGRSDRLLTVNHNLRLLEHVLSGPAPSWDCIVYTYALPTDSSFWGSKAELDFLLRYCTIVENPGKRVTENLYMVQPALIKDKYKFIFILLDDCKLLGDTKFELDFMIAVLKENKLTLASPQVIGANTGGGQKFRNIMQTDARPASVGFESVFVELFAWIMSPEAYHALWDLLYPSVNPYGWGYDLWYDNYARGKVSGHKMGIISVIHVKHEQNFSAPGSGRTDSASVHEKWNALRQQEIVYQSHFNVDLKRFRQNLRLANASLFGAVTGLLHSTSRTPPTSREASSLKELNSDEGGLAMKRPPKKRRPSSNVP